MIRTLAIALALTTSAFAQTAEVTPVAAPETTAATPESTPAAVAPPAVPTNPTELIAFARADALEAQQCRFAFSRAQTTAAQSGWSGADAEMIVRFDPRLPIGERWTVVHATRQQRAMERSLAREDRKALPFDLMTLTAEGEYTFENIELRAEHEDRLVYSFQPRMVPTRIASETGQGIIEQLVGEVEVSRATGRIISTTLREPPADSGAVRAMGIVRVHRALLRNGYVAGADDRLMIETGTQMFAMSAMLSQTEVTTSFRFSEIEPICDPAEVARINAAEAAAQAGSSRRR